MSATKEIAEKELIKYLCKRYKFDELLTLNPSSAANKQGLKALSKKGLLKAYAESLHILYSASLDYPVTTWPKMFFSVQPNYSCNPVERVKKQEADIRRPNNG